MILFSGFRGNTVTPTEACGQRPRFPPSLYFVACSKNRSSAAKSSALSIRRLGALDPGVTTSGRRVSKSPIACYSAPTRRESEYARAKWPHVATRKMRPKEPWRSSTAGQISSGIGELGRCPVSVNRKPCPQETAAQYAAPIVNQQA